VRRTTRIALAAGTAAAVTVLALTLHALHSRGGAPPAQAVPTPPSAAAAPDPAPPPSAESVRLNAPAGTGRDPQASLMQPDPAVPAPAAAAPSPEAEAPRRVTVARWPLGAPVLHEFAPPDPPPAPEPNWSRPQPLESAAPPVLADAAKPAPAVAGALRPMPAAAAAPRHRAPARAAAGPFTGTHACLLETDGSLLLPHDVRRRLDAPEARALFVTPGPEPSLWLYTGTGLAQWAGQFDQAAAASRARAARRTVLAQTEACAVDRGGRLRLPDALVQFAGLQHEVVLLGVGDHLELWDARRWQQHRDGAGGATSRADGEGGR
jgi:MraZ protein